MSNEEKHIPRYCLFWDGSFEHNEILKGPSPNFIMFETPDKDKYISFEFDFIETQDYNSEDY